MTVVLALTAIGTIAITFLLWVLIALEMHIRSRRREEHRRVLIPVSRMTTENTARPGPALVYSQPTDERAGDDAGRAWLHSKAGRLA
ncbi:MAG: hypothetical protein P4M01_01005 [Acidobacteriota bacterium]|nr:hypothetical protein [Acidobacteriota bacterium]